MKKKLTTTALLLAVCLFAAACGKKSSEPANQGNPGNSAGADVAANAVVNANDAAPAAKGSVGEAIDEAEISMPNGDSIKIGSDSKDYTLHEMLGSKESWAYVKEGRNGHIVITAVPSTEYNAMIENGELVNIDGIDFAKIDANSAALLIPGTYTALYGKSETLTADEIITGINTMYVTIAGTGYDPGSGVKADDGQDLSDMVEKATDHDFTAPDGWTRGSDPTPTLTNPDVIVCDYKMNDGDIAMIVTVNGASKISDYENGNTQGIDSYEITGSKEYDMNGTAIKVYHGTASYPKNGYVFAYGNAKYDMHHIKDDQEMTDDEILSVLKAFLQ